jgi:peptidoglycan lytic transglycosylase
MLRTGATAVIVALAISTVLFATGEKPKRKPNPWLRVSATAYCLKGITGSGARTRPGTVAADPRLIPLGSTIHVRGLRGARDGTYAVLDTGRAIRHHEIDIFMPSCRAARRFGRQDVRVRILSRADP